MIPLILGWLLSASLPAPPLPSPTTAASIASLAPEANREAIELALAAMRCAQKSGVGVDASRLAFIDYSRPSTEPRLWVFDLRSNRLLYEEVVAHGRGSGENLAKVFSNVSGSHASSLGLFLTRETYQGRNGYSLRMDGLEPGVNDAAMRARDRHARRAVRGPGRGREAGPPRPQLRLPRRPRGRCARHDRRAEGRAVRVRVLPGRDVAGPF